VSTPGIVLASGVRAASAPGPVQPPGVRTTPASPLGWREENLPPDSSQHLGGEVGEATRSSMAPLDAAAPNTSGHNSVLPLSSDEAVSSRPITRA
jgi:hypothetical protein